MKKTLFYLPEELHRFLAEEAGSRGVSMAEIAREAIGQYRAAQRGQRRARPTDIIGLLSDVEVPDDFIENVDKYVYEAIDEEFRARGLCSPEFDSDAAGPGRLDDEAAK